MTEYGELAPGDLFRKKDGEEKTLYTYIVTDDLDDDCGHYYAVCLDTGELWHFGHQDEVQPVPRYEVFRVTPRMNES